MKKEVVDKWTEALRSGNYPQCSDMLKNSEGSFCCLGVLCDISELGEWSVSHDGEERFLTKDNKKKFGDKFLPPPCVMDWSGISRWAEDEGGDNLIYCDLVNMNDKGVPFSKIADYIEQNWKEL